MLMVSKRLAYQFNFEMAVPSEEKCSTHDRKKALLSCTWEPHCHALDIGHGIQFSSWIQFNSIGYLHCYCFYLSQVKYKPFGFHGYMASASLRRTNGCIGLNNSYSIVNLINSVKHCVFFCIRRVCVVLLSFS